MRILGIETSCDETAVAIVSNGTKIISNVVASSVELHAKTGGIIPENAARQQTISMIPVLEETLKQAKVDPRSGDGIDAIAVTYGPGLIGSLLVGVETAKTLALLWNKPIIPVNHLLAHLYANWLEKSTEDTPQFPAVGLVVSGGHSDLVLIKDHGDVTWLGGTRDDAAGEAFDKLARLLGLGYPGGPAIARAADQYLPNATHTKHLDLFPRPLKGDRSYDFSFSGLKTAVLRYTQEFPNKSVYEVAANVQEAIVDSLIEKTLRAAINHKVKSIVLGGGVSCNIRLRMKLQGETFTNDLEAHLHVPKLEYCTDNAAVIAACAYFNQKPTPPLEVSADPELAIV